MQLLGAHWLALYDALRLCGVGVSTIGAGTAEAQLRVLLRGLDWCRYLPPGLGEACSVRRRGEEKLARAADRRKEALAALERERLRREITEEDKERMRRDKVAAAQRERDEEERLAQDAASLVLGEYREAVTAGRAATHAEALEVMAQWRGLAEVKSNRYPYTLKAAIAHVNAAVVVLEIEVEEDSAGQLEAKALVTRGLHEGMHALLALCGVQGGLSDPGALPGS